MQKVSSFETWQFSTRPHAVTFEKTVMSAVTSGRNSNTVRTVTIHAGDLVGAITLGENFLHPRYIFLLFPETTEEHSWKDAYFKLAAVGVNTKYVGILFKKFVNKPFSKYWHFRRKLYTCLLFFTFFWPCISVYLSHYLTKLMHKIFFTISFISCLYMFRARARHQEVKIALHSLWYRHTHRWPSRRRPPIGVTIPEAV